MEPVSISHSSSDVQAVSYILFGITFHFIGCVCDGHISSDTIFSFDTVNKLTTGN